MQNFSRDKAVLVLVVSALILSTFLLLMATKTVTNVSAVEVNRVGVYWDSSCTGEVLSIGWGILTPGSMKSIVVYIRNEVEEPIYLILNTTNWGPSKASDYLTLKWDYSGQRMNPDEILQITLTLSVSNYIEGISSFSFDIIINGSDSLPLSGDVNGDRTVNIVDIVLYVLASGSKLGDPNWDPRVDINQDGIINDADFLVIATHFGETC
jgi:hypothetical protein